MSREIRKTGVLAMVVMLAATLSGCRLAKKDEDGTVKKTLYGAYAVVGKSLDDPDIPDPEMEGTTVGQKDKKGFVHFKKIKGYFFFHKYDQKENTISMDGDPQLTHFSGGSNMKKEISLDLFKMARSKKINGKRQASHVRQQFMFRKQKESQKCRLEVYIKEQMVHFIWNLQEGLLCRIFVKQEGL